MRKLLVASLLMISTVAAADSKQDSRDAKQLVTDDCAKARKQGKTCVIDMGKEELEGVVGKGDGMKIDSLTFKWLGSMIRLRRDYIAEIVKSAEDLD